jgi:hypothetical protein
VAQYRLGHYREAADTLTKSLAAGRGQSDACDLYLLAMCRHHLGDPAGARDCFRRAGAWRQGRPNLPAREAPEFDPFRVEAAALLGLTDRTAGPGGQTPPGMP